MGVAVDGGPLRRTAEERPGGLVEQNLASQLMCQRLHALFTCGVLFSHSCTFSNDTPLFSLFWWLKPQLQPHPEWRELLEASDASATDPSDLAMPPRVCRRPAKLQVFQISLSAQSIAASYGFLGASVRLRRGSPAWSRSIIVAGVIYCLLL
jgi:hypothetical protein